MKGLVNFQISSNLQAIDLIETDNELDLLKHLSVFMLASQLDINELKALALQRFQTQLQEDWLVKNLVDCIEEIYKGAILLLLEQLH